MSKRISLTRRTLRSTELQARPGRGERELQREAGRLGLSYEVCPPIGRFYPDLVFPAVRLIVEVDGGYHWGKEQQASDKVRDRALTQAGWKVIRVWAADALAKPAEVLAGAFVTAFGLGHDAFERCRVVKAPPLRSEKPKPPKPAPRKKPPKVRPVPRPVPVFLNNGTLLRLV